MTEQPIDPDAEYRARFDELELQRALEEAEEQLERNTRSLADVFIEYMDRSDRLEISVGANRWTGFVVAVGDDVVTIALDQGRVDIPLSAVTLTKLLPATAGRARSHRAVHSSSFIARLRDLAGANAGLAVEIGGPALTTLAGELRAVAETHVELMTASGDLNVISLGAIGFVLTSP